MKCINCFKENSIFCSQKCKDEHYTKFPSSSEKVETGKVNCGGFEESFDLDTAMKNGGKCRTRDGRDARIICTDVKGAANLCVIALVTDEQETEIIMYYTKQGRILNERESGYDLFNIPEINTIWLNIYHDNSDTERSISEWRTKEDADKYAVKNRTACVKVEYKDGDGL